MSARRVTIRAAKWTALFLLVAGEMTVVGVPVEGYTVAAAIIALAAGYLAGRMEGGRHV